MVEGMCKNGTLKAPISIKTLPFFFWILLKTTLLTSEATEQYIVKKLNKTEAKPRLVEEEK